MLFEGKVYIRLTEDFSAFVSTERYAGIFSKSAEFSLHDAHDLECLDESDLEFERRRPRRRTAPEQS